MEQLNASDAKFSVFIEEQRRTNHEINAKLNQLNVIAGNVERNSQRISSLEQSCAALARDVGDMRKHQASSDSASHNQTDNMLIISGVPSAASVTSLTIVRNVFSKLGIPELTCHILDVRAVSRESRRGTPHNSLPASSTVSLFVTLASAAVRDAVILKKRACRVLVQRDVCENDSGRNIYVNELLPKNIYELLTQAKRAAKERSYRYVWVSGGRINVRRSDGEPVIRVDSVADLDKLT
ncbi:uncharacterized protein LOC118645382 [Monomorium pharaonis]|uniref:uncharacterized protein LOC118645382 n=1 Tax=Monomorium pharaonis TaxID=307658 RepID=UPI0017468EEB|nr:uncharacterized protein LOC118645382 [Monomorium pharaonis]